jgi:hypothetical protein
MQGIGNRRRIPHDLFRDASDVDAGAAEPARLDQKDACAMLGGALRGGEPAEAAAEGEQVELGQ